MSWLPVITIYLASATAHSLLFRVTAATNPKRVLLSTLVIDVLSLAPIIIIVNLFFDVSYEYSWVFWAAMVAGGFCFTAANMITYLVSSRMDAAQFSIIYTIRPMLAILLSSLIIGESLAGEQYFGAALIIGSSLTIATLHARRQTLSGNWITLVAVAGFCFGAIASVNEKYLLNSIGYLNYVAVGLAVQLMTTGFITGSTARGLPGVTRKLWRNLAILSVLRVTYAVTYITALKLSDNISLVSAATTYRTALIAAGSYFILKEKDHPRTKLIATGTATVGLLLLR